MSCELATVLCHDNMAKKKHKLKLFFIVELLIFTLCLMFVGLFL